MKGCQVVANLDCQRWMTYVKGTCVQGTTIVRVYILQYERVINTTLVKDLTSPFIFAGSHMTVNNSPRVGQVDNGRRNQKTMLAQP